MSTEEENNNENKTNEIEEMEGYTISLSPQFIEEKVVELGVKDEFLEKGETLKITDMVLGDDYMLHVNVVKLPIEKVMN